MTEKVCRCEPADNATVDKIDGSKAKEKLRLFSRKKSNSLNKNVCSKCGLPFATNDSSVNVTTVTTSSTSRNASDIQNQNVTQLRTPPPKSLEENAVVQGAIIKEAKKTSRKQSEELPQIPVKASEYLYQNPASGERGVAVDNIYTEIEEKPEKKFVSSAPSENPVPANRRRPTTSGGPLVRGQTGGGQLSNGGYLNNCDCPKCRSQRGQDLTVELLPMDTQVTLQSMMQGATLMCNLL